MLFVNMVNVLKIHYRPLTGLGQHPYARPIFGLLSGVSYKTVDGGSGIVPQMKSEIARMARSNP